LRVSGILRKKITRDTDLRNKYQHNRTYHQQKQKIIHYSTEAPRMSMLNRWSDPVTAWPWPDRQWLTLPSTDAGWALTDIVWHAQPFSAWQTGWLSLVDGHWYWLTDWHLCTDSDWLILMTVCHWHWLASTDWQTQTDRPTHAPTKWLTDWLTHGFTDSLIHRADSLTDWLTDCYRLSQTDRHWLHSTDWLTLTLTDWQTDTDWLIYWLTDWLTDWLTLTDWLARKGWLTHRALLPQLSARSGVRTSRQSRE